MAAARVRESMKTAEERNKYVFVYVLWKHRIRVIPWEIKLSISQQVSKLANKQSNGYAHESENGLCLCGSLCVCVWNTEIYILAYIQINNNQNVKRKKFLHNIATASAVCTTFSLVIIADIFTIRTNSYIQTYSTRAFHSNLDVYVW